MSANDGVALFLGTLILIQTLIHKVLIILLLLYLSLKLMCFYCWYCILEGFQWLLIWRLLCFYFCV